MDMIRRKAEAGATKTDTSSMDTSRELPVWRSPSLVAGSDADGGSTAAVADGGELQRIPGGNAPWEESEEIREARVANALKRKAIRASRRAAQEG